MVHSVIKPVRHADVRYWAADLGQVVQSPTHQLTYQHNMGVTPKFGFMQIMNTDIGDRYDRVFSCEGWAVQEDESPTIQQFAHAFSCRGITGQDSRTVYHGQRCGLMANSSVGGNIGTARVVSWTPTEVTIEYESGNITTGRPWQVQLVLMGGSGMSVNATTFTRPDNNQTTVIPINLPNHPFSMVWGMMGDQARGGTWGAAQTEHIEALYNTAMWSPYSEGFSLAVSSIANRASSGRSITLQSMDAFMSYCRDTNAAEAYRVIDWSETQVTLSMDYVNNGSNAWTGRECPVVAIGMDSPERLTIGNDITLAGGTNLYNDPPAPHGLILALHNQRTFDLAINDIARRDAQGGYGVYLGNPRGDSSISDQFAMSFALENERSSDWANGNHSTTRFQFLRVRANFLVDNEALSRAQTPANHTQWQINVNNNVYNGTPYLFFRPQRETT